MVILPFVVFLSEYRIMPDKYGVVRGIPAPYLTGPEQ